MDTANQVQYRLGRASAPSGDTRACHRGRDAAEEGEEEEEEEEEEGVERVRCQEVLSHEVQVEFGVMSSQMGGWPSSSSSAFRPLHNSKCKRF